MTIQNDMQTALRFHLAGRMDEAENLYRRVLQQAPQHGGALHLMGAICLQRGNSDQAIEWISRAVAADPNVAEYHSNLAEAYRRVGRLEEALASVRRSVELAPNFAAAHSNLGNVLLDMGRLQESVAASRRAITLRGDFAEPYGHLGNALRQQGRLDEAIGALRQAVRLRPDNPHAHNNLGTALKEQGSLDEAIAEYRQAIALKPDLAELHNNLGCALDAQGLREPAVASLRRAIELRPDYAEAYNNLGIALRGPSRTTEVLAAFHRAIELRGDVAEFHNNLGNALGSARRFEEAIAAFGRAIELNPNFAGVHKNLAVVLTDAGRLEQAIAACRRAIQLDPKYADAHNSLAVAMREAGRFEEAIAACRRAIQLDPDFADAHWNLALFLLATGEMAEGWRKYEWRWKVKNLQSPRDFSQPQWDGTDLAGGTILLHAEQGFGDTIQFIRYAPLVAARGGRVIVECQGELVRLLRASLCVEQIIVGGDPLPPFDVHCPIASLPGAFGTDLSSIPTAAAYLTAPRDAAQIWKGKLAGEARALKVGLAWAGRPTHRNDRHRSIALSQLAPLAGVNGVRFYSLQKGEAARQTPPAEMRWIDLTGELYDFADTAALVANLDLVITVDTSVAHLAGALGKPTWVLLPHIPDWRWLRDRQDSPWYPTMRLFRQEQAADWRQPLAEMAEALNELARSAGRC